MVLSSLFLSPTQRGYQVWTDWKQFCLTFYFALFQTYTQWNQASRVKWLIDNNNIILFAYLILLFLKNLAPLLCSYTSYICNKWKAGVTLKIRRESGLCYSRPWRTPAGLEEFFSLMDHGRGHSGQQLVSSRHRSVSAFWQQPWLCQAPGWMPALVKGDGNESRERLFAGFGFSSR